MAVCQKSQGCKWRKHPLGRQLKIRKQGRGQGGKAVHFSVSVTSPQAAASINLLLTVQFFIINEISSKRDFPSSVRNLLVVGLQTMLGAYSETVSVSTGYNWSCDIVTQFFSAPSLQCTGNSCPRVSSILLKRMIIQYGSNCI